MARPEKAYLMIVLEKEREARETSRKLQGIQQMNGTRMKRIRHKFIGPDKPDEHR